MNALSAALALDNCGADPALYAALVAIIEHAMKAAANPNLGDHLLTDLERWARQHASK